MDYVAVLTAARGVTDAHIADAQAALGDASLPRRVSDQCVEIDLASEAPPVEVAGVDVNVVPAANRRKKLLLADMDSTIISVECIDELADFAGVKDQVAAITEIAMRGELDFKEALFTRVALLKNMPRSIIDQCYEERVRLNPGARTLGETMKARGAMTAIVSGGFTAFADKVAKASGFAMARANVLGIEGDTLSGTVDEPIVTASTKLDTLSELARRGGFEGSDVLAVGDGANDAQMIQAAGLGVAYYAKPALKAAANAQINHSDLSALLHLQGIPETEWVRHTRN